MPTLSIIHIFSLKYQLLISYWTPRKKWMDLSTQHICVSIRFSRLTSYLLILGWNLAAQILERRCFVHNRIEFTIIFSKFMITRSYKCGRADGKRDNIQITFPLKLMPKNADNTGGALHITTWRMTYSAEPKKEKQSLVYIRRAGNEQIKKPTDAQFSSVLIFVLYFQNRKKREEHGSSGRWHPTDDFVEDVPGPKAEPENEYLTIKLCLFMSPSASCHIK